MSIRKAKMILIFLMETSERSIYLNFKILSRWVPVPEQLLISINNIAVMCSCNTKLREVSQNKLSPECTDVEY